MTSPALYSALSEPEPAFERAHLHQKMCTWILDQETFHFRSTFQPDKGYPYAFFHFLKSNGSLEGISQGSEDPWGVSQSDP